MSLLSVSIKDRAKCYATLHLNIHEYLRSYNVCKVLNKEDYITLKQTTSLLKKKCPSVESQHYLARFTTLSY